MKPDNVSREIVRTALENYPDTPNLTLARFLFETEPKVFTSAEQARCIIRYFKGQNGQKNKNKILDKSHISESGDSRKGWKALPRGDGGSWNPHVLPDGKYLILGDVHVPYHDEVALQIALEYGFKVGVTGVIYDGDYFDFYSLSKFVKDPRKRSASDEIATGQEIWCCVKSQLNCKYNALKIGNHDIRMLHYLWRTSPHLCGIRAFELENIIEADRFGITVIQSEQVIKAGALPIIHGHEYMRGISSPVNAARGYFIRAISSVLGAHYHQASTHCERTINGDDINTWSIGCLCNLHPEYAPLNKWSHGFAVVSVAGNDFELENKRISSDKRILTI
jgi:hypothetical protein